MLEEGDNVEYWNSVHKVSNIMSLGIIVDIANKTKSLCCTLVRATKAFV